MPIVTWDGNLEIGIEALDKQHEYLFEVINNLYHKIVKGRNRAAVVDLVDSMKNFVRYHFELEERLMAKSKYPELSKHKQAHARFIEAMEKYEFLGDASMDTLPIEALAFLIDWALWHFLTVDKRFVSHVKRNMDEKELNSLVSAL